MRRRRRACHPPAHPRPAQPGTTAESDQPGGNTGSLRRYRQPAGSGEIERPGIAPQFADHGAQRAASQTLLHRPQRRLGIAYLDMQQVEVEARGMYSPRLENRHPLLHPQQRPVVRQQRAQQARPPPVAWGRGEQLGQGGAVGPWHSLHAPVANRMTERGRPGFNPATRRMSTLPGVCRRQEGRSEARVRTAARDQGETCRHTTRNILFQFCSSTSNPRGRVNGGEFLEETANFGDDPKLRTARDGKPHVARLNLHRAVAFAFEPARGANRDDSVAARP